MLTKSAERNTELNPILDWAPNVCMGVSVEQPTYLPRVEQLKSTGAPTKFLSIEPLLESLGDFDLTGIDWIIVGGKSGLALARCIPIGAWAFGNSASNRMSRSSLRNGAEPGKRGQGASSMVRLGIKCRRPL